MALPGKPFSFELHDDDATDRVLTTPDEFANALAQLVRDADDVIESDIRQPIVETFSDAGILCGMNEAGFVVIMPNGARFVARITRR